MERYFVAILVVESILLAVLDRLMRKNKRPEVPPDRLRWVPLYWESPDLFTPRGNRYRLGALATAGVIVVTFLVMVLVVGAENI